MKYQPFKILAMREFQIEKMSVLSVKETLLLLSVTSATFLMIGTLNLILKFSSSKFPNPVFHGPGPLLSHVAGDLRSGRCPQGEVGGLSLDPDNLDSVPRLRDRLSVCDRYYFCLVVWSTH